VTDSLSTQMNTEVTEGTQLEMGRKHLDRRQLLAGTAAAAGVAAVPRPARAQQKPQRTALPKALIFGMLPGSLSVEDRFKLARDVGFDGVETAPVADPAQCERMRAAAEKVGMRVHSVIYGGWDPPLTHPDAEARKRSVENAKAALRSAKALGADCILLVPGVVNAQAPYAEAHRRAREGVRQLIPTAEELKVPILIEEVWNNFLLSPLEFNAFVDSFRSRWVQAYFDVGNVVPFGWPEDWIRTLGRRIKKIHLKDFKGGPGLFGGIKGEFVNLRDGSVNWPEVRRALSEIGFNDYVTCELRGGDEAYLRDVSQRVDKILRGE
jgi:L-ribulose-5-phosphate 3-epimerase